MSTKVKATKTPRPTSVKKEKKSKVKKAEKSPEDLNEEVPDLPTGKKKRKLTESEDEITMEANPEIEDIEVSFEIVEPSEPDFQGVRSWLTHFADSRIFDVSGMAEALVEQPNIGGFVKLSEDISGVSGMYTTLNINFFRTKPFMVSILEVLKERSKKLSVGGPNELLPYLEDKSKQIGLMVTNRALNIPDELVPQMLQSFLDDIKWSQTEGECDQAERKSYFYTHFLFWVHASRREGQGKTQLEDLEFSNFEDAVLVKKAEVTFLYPAPQFQLQSAESSAKPSKKRKKKLGGAPNMAHQMKGGNPHKVLFLISKRAFEECLPAIAKHQSLK